nr:Gag-Pol polyprotein [Tanacetum cinerariifolium]
MSTEEAEYVALSASCAQVIWMIIQIKDYGFDYNKIPMYYDSQSAIAILYNPVQHSRAKHISVRYHFIKEHAERGIVELYFVRIEYQLADMFTKALSRERNQCKVTNHQVNVQFLLQLQPEWQRVEIDQNDNDNDLAIEQKCECLETELSKSKMMSKSFESVQKHAINLELELQQVTTQTLPSNKKSILKNMNVLAPGMYKLHTDHNQTRTSQLPQDSRKTNKRVSFSIGVIPTTSVSRPQLKRNPMGDRVMRNNNQGKKQEVKDQRRNIKLPKSTTSVTACTDSLNAKTLNVNSVCATCDISRKDCPIYRRLWVLKAHDGKSQASN